MKRVNEDDLKEPTFLRLANFNASSQRVVLLVGGGNHKQLTAGHFPYGLLTKKVAVVTLKVVKHYGENLTLQC